ncbi:MAG TPA: NAD(P)/FAD-dependent oxidoreductase [Frankiaceae bacterium]|nr:NAD(P)/FAD-dependent oxidoreductase [Frankiaceae bacterium]
MSQYDVVVIGAGQAGLAAGHALRDTGLGFTVLEAGEQPGGSWPRFYDSLTLFSPARYCALPGLRFPGDQARYPHRDEAASYLRQYAERMRLPIRTRSRVAAVRPRTGSGFEVELADGTALVARAVVAATGQFGAPRVPDLPGMTEYAGELLHVSAYRRPDEYAGKRVVVVGGGNSAIQVAVELDQVADVTLATRSAVKIRRQRPLGIDLHHWLHYSRIDALPLGRRAAASVGVLDEGRYGAALAAGRPEPREMFSAFTPDGVRWADGSEEHVDAVVLATGYRPNLDFLPSASFEPDGWPAHRRGLSTTLPGLAFVGLPGQTGVASAMLRGVGPDARHVVRRLTRLLRAAPLLRSPREIPA